MFKCLYVDMLTIIFLLIFTLTDLYKRIIPNSLLAIMFLVSLWLHQNTLSEFFTALLISTIFIIILYKLKFFAGGDTKLLIILGAIAGYPNLFYLFATIFIIGGFQAVLYKYFSSNFNQQQNKKDKQKNNSLPYALSILIGYFIFTLLQSNL